MEGRKRFHGQATRSASAHDHPFASVSLDDECDRVIKPFRIKLEIEVADRRNCPQRSGRLALARGPQATKSERGPRRRSGNYGGQDGRMSGFAACTS